MRVLDTVVKLYILIVAADVGLAWTQAGPARRLRRLTGALTEPPERLLRLIAPPARLGGWDLSPLLLIAALGALRLTWMQP